MIYGTGLKYDLGENKDVEILEKKKKTFLNRIRLNA